MAYPTHIKKEVMELRKCGSTLLDIAKKTGLAKSTVSLWVRDAPLLPEVHAMLQGRKKRGSIEGLRVLADMRARRRHAISSDAVADIANLSDNSKIFWRLCAALLFWCEGSKDLSSMVFTNSDPRLMALFLRALRQGFDLDERKFRVLIHLHDYHDALTQTKFWSEVTGIPVARFNRPYRKPHTGKRKREGYQGCLSLRYGDATLAQKLSALYHAFAQ